MTVPTVFKLLTLFTGIMYPYIQQTAAAAAYESTVVAAAAAAAAAQAASAAADAAAASAAAAAAAVAAAEGRPFHLGSQGGLWSAMSGRRDGGSRPHQRPPHNMGPGAGTAPGAAFDSSFQSPDARINLDTPNRGSQERSPFGSFAPAEPTSVATPPGVGTALPSVDTSTEDSSTFEPRLYLSTQQQQQQQQRQQKWMDPEKQQDVLLQHLLQHTAAQAWDNHRRQRFEESETAVGDFLARRVAPPK